MVLFLLLCSLPDVALPPPRMVLFGALAQVLLVPPSGYRCFRRRPGCLASVRGVLWRIVSPLVRVLLADPAVFVTLVKPAQRTRVVRHGALMFVLCGWVRFVRIYVKRLRRGCL